MTPIDVERTRAETPGCAHRLHLNHAGASLMPEPVLRAVTDHLEREAAIGGYEAQDEAKPRIAAVYESIARLVGARPDEIALLENATRAWDAVFYSLRFQPGDRILTGRAEYGSNYLAYLQAAERRGAEIVVVPDDGDGQLDVGALRELLDGRAKLVGVTHVPTSGGLVNPAREVGAACREAGVPFLLDACQSVGQMPIDVDELGCDFLSATGRKFLRGPRGTGFLYVRESALGLLDPWVLDVRSAEWLDERRYVIADGARRFETWEVSVACQLGLGAAVEYALGIGLEPIWERVHALAARLREALDALPRVTTRDLGRVRCGIVTFSVDGTEADAVADALARERINVSVSTPEDTRLDFMARGLPPLVRASVHYVNTEDELDRAVEAVARITR